MVENQREPILTGPETLGFTTRTPLDITRENVRQILGTTVSNPELLPIDREVLKGKVVVITGSSRGIGAATARFFAQHEMKIAVNSRVGSREQAEEVVRDIKKAGSEGLWIPADVIQPEEAKRLIDKTVESFARIDIAVLNVGKTNDSLMITMEPEQWYDVQRTNGDGTFFPALYVSRQMRKQRSRGGTIIFNGSIGDLGLPGQTAYAYTKAGELAMADAMAREFKGLVIAKFRAGLVDTDLTANLSTKQRQNLIDLMPAGRSFRPEEAARCIAFLATFRESGHTLNMA